MESITINKMRTQWGTCIGICSMKNQHVPSSANEIIAAYMFRWARLVQNKRSLLVLRSS